MEPDGFAWFNPCDVGLPIEVEPDGFCPFVGCNGFVNTYLVLAGFEIGFCSAGFLLLIAGLADDSIFAGCEPVFVVATGLLELWFLYSCSISTL